MIFTSQIMYSAIAFACLASIGMSYPSQEEEIDLSLKITLGESIRVRTGHTAEFEHVVNPGADETRFPTYGIRTTDWIDRYDELSDDLRSATRYVLKHHSSTNGYLTDGPWTGVLMRFSEDQERIGIDCERGHRFREDQMQELWRQWPPLGLWLEMPNSTSIGDEFALDLTKLGPLLLFDAAWQEVNAVMRLEHYDSTTHSANLSGTFDASGRLLEANSPLAIKLTGQIKMTIDTQAQRLTKIGAQFDLSGHGELADGTPATITGNLITVVEAELVNDPKPFLKEQPQFRKVRHRYQEGGLSLKLPSHWTVSENNQEHALWFNTMDGDASIELLVLKSNIKDPIEFREEALASLVSEFGELEPKSTKSALGKGWLVVVKFNDEYGDRISQFEYYQVQDGWVRLSLEAKLKEFNQRKADLESARKSLKTIQQ